MRVWNRCGCRIDRLLHDLCRYNHAQPHSFAYSDGHAHTVAHPDADGQPFGYAQGKPFGYAQGKPFGYAQGKPFGYAQGKPYRHGNSQPNPYCIPYQHADGHADGQPHRHADG